LEILNDILDFSKIEAGKLHMEILDFELNTLLHEIDAVMSGRIQEKGLKFHYHITPDTPLHLKGDPNRLRQIIVNLLSNALKFTIHGKIEAHVSLKSSTATEALILFSVRDTGMGIPEDKLPNLFQKFSQVDASTTRRFGGTGLGLAICKQLAGLMGGEIGVNSELGKGSEFWFTARLPIQITNPTALHFQPSRKVWHVKKRILLAEDNAVNQLVAVSMLKKMGIHVDVVSNGLDAIKALESTHYDLILMDMQMPEMDGLEATKHIRNHASNLLNHDIFIIAMTANAMQRDRDLCQSAGMNDFMTKPISVHALEKMLEKWIP
jgi:CheY-like chemotaxis protein